MPIGDQSVTGAYAKIEGHEALCNERHNTINQKLNGIGAGIVIVALGMLGWMAIQLYTLEPVRVAAEHAATREEVLQRTQARYTAEDAARDRANQDAVNRQILAELAKLAKRHPGLAPPRSGPSGGTL